MIHTLQYQSEALLKASYFNLLRKVMNPESDTIHLTMAHSHLQELSTEDIYKKVLQLDGKYRAEIKKMDFACCKSYSHQSTKKPVTPVLI